MPSSFFKRSALKLVTPFKYSMGLANMEDSVLIGIVFTNIHGSLNLPAGAGKKLPLRHKNTEKDVE